MNEELVMNDGYFYDQNGLDIPLNNNLRCQGTTSINHYHYNPLIYTTFRDIMTIKQDFNDYGISVTDKIIEENKKMKRHISEMQTEINNLRAENQLFHKSLKEFIKETKKIMEEKIKK